MSWPVDSSETAGSVEGRKTMWSVYRAVDPVAPNGNRFGNRHDTFVFSGLLKWRPETVKIRTVE